MIQATAEQIKEKYDLAVNRIESFHLRNIGGLGGPSFLISTAYPGVWMEHAFDGVCYARLFADRNPDAAQVAMNQMRLFVSNIREDGRLPYVVMDHDLIAQKPQWGKDEVRFTQIQECVSLARLCYEAYELSGDKNFLAECYDACARFDGWLVKHRMTRGTGLIEMFCVFDTGHDNSMRFDGIPNGCRDKFGTVPADHKRLPILAPDMNAVFYGDRLALSNMAKELGKTDEAAEWAQKAEETREKIMELLYDPETEFFYDLDADGTKSPVKSISITNVFSEKVVDQATFDRIYDRHFKNPEEFATPYPFPSVSYDQASAFPHADKNCWGYFSQALTALRAQRWMDHYGRSADYDEVLRKWVNVYASQTDVLFSQEMDPVTGEVTDCSRWYSSAMLTYIYAVKRLKLV